VVVRLMADFQRGLSIIADIAVKRHKHTYE